MVTGLGLAMMGLASMMYEDEEGRLQSRIKRFQGRVENWWIKVDDSRKASMPWVAQFVQAFANLVGRCLDRIFTKRLLSMRLVGISLLLSMASSLLSIIVLPLILHSARLPSPGNAVFQFSRLLILTLLPAISESPSMPLKPWLPRIMRFLWWIFIIRIILTVADFLVFTAHSSAAGASLAANAAILLPLLFGLSATCDVSFILFTRWTFRRISTSNTVRGILLWILLLLLFLVLVLVATPLAGVGVMKYSMLAGGILLFSIFVNSIDIVLVLATLIVAGLLLAHRVVWPLIERPLYAIQRIELVDRGEWKKRKSWLWAFGVFLIVIAIPGLPSWIKALLEKI